MIFKSLVLLSVLAVFIEPLHAETGPNDLIVGAREVGDKLEIYQPIRKPYQILQVVEYQRTFATPTGRTITQVRLLDRATGGTGATPSIINGGPGYNYVTVHLKSKRNRGIEFVLEIYGR